MTRPYQILDKHTIVGMSCLIWTSNGILHLMLPIWCDVPLLNPFLQKRKSATGTYNRKTVIGFFLISSGIYQILPRYIYGAPTIQYCYRVLHWLYVSGQRYVIIFIWYYLNISSLISIIVAFIVSQVLFETFNVDCTKYNKRNVCCAASIYVICFTIILFLFNTYYE